MFDWCASGDHAGCRREYERFHFAGNQLIWTGEIRKCQCRKRGCKCYVPPAERTKTRKRRKKTK